MHHNFGYEAWREMFYTLFCLSFNAVSTLRRPPGEKREKHVKNYLKIAIFFSFWPKSDKI